MVKKLASENNIEFTEAVFVKGLEVGISMFIQKEQGSRFRKA